MQDRPFGSQRKRKFLSIDFLLDISPSPLLCHCKSLWVYVVREAFSKPAQFCKTNHICGSHPCKHKAGKTMKHPFPLCSIMICSSLVEPSAAVSVISSSETCSPFFFGHFLECQVRTTQEPAKMKVDSL